MSKSLYSLILSDEVVAELDRAALKAGTNRSQLANRILAEHLSLLTPERRIEEIFRTVDRFFNEGAEMVSRFTPHQPVMQLKTALAYRYRPTLRYELRLYPEAQDGQIGEIHMILRTQAEELLMLLDAFARDWIRAERALGSDGEAVPLYELQPGRFTRTICLPREGLEPAAFGDRLTRYVRLLDESFKEYLCSRVSGAELEYRIQEEMKGETV